LLITEYGTDAFTTTSFHHEPEPDGDLIVDEGYEDEATQASYAESLWDEIVSNADVCLGGTIMEYSDEWWKDIKVNAPHTQDIGGYELSAHQDGIANEEWWGLMAPYEGSHTVDEMRPRQIYDFFKEKWESDKMIDDFNDGDCQNLLGGENAGYASPDSYCVGIPYNEDLDNVLGNSGYSLEIRWGITDSMAENDWGTLAMDFQQYDARIYKAVSFWVKGSVGGEKFGVQIKDIEGPDWHMTTIPIQHYLPGGVTNQWQKVTIPLAAFKDVHTHDSLDGFAIVFEEELRSGTGIIYIDDVKFEGESQPILVDNFDSMIDENNDFIYENALTGNMFTLIYPSTDIFVTIYGTHDRNSPVSGTGQCYHITYSGIHPGAGGIWVTRLDGVNVSDKDTLTFYIKGLKGGEIPNIYLGDISGNKAYVDIEDYVTVTQSWQRVNIPLADFSSRGIDLSCLMELQFVFEWELMSGVIYIDEIAFVNYTTLITPTLESIPEITNADQLTLTGTKEAGTAILVNNVEVVPLDEETSWSYVITLLEGQNAIRIKARDMYNNISPEITAVVTLDTTPPIADAGTDVIAYRNTAVRFDGSASADNVGIADYTWDFGDGSPAESGIRVTHLFSDVNVFTVTLTVTDLAGNGPITDELTIDIQDDSDLIRIGGPAPDFTTIQEGIDNATAADTIYIHPGGYPEDLLIPSEKEGIVIMGENRLTTIINGNIVLKNVSATISNLTILYGEGEVVSYTNDYYADWTTLADAAITALDSEVSVTDCIITPDPSVFTTHYGKGIQRWNMYHSTPIAPSIENNLILNTHIGVIYFVQAFGGEILGNISNNTFVTNDDGIILRMHKEKPVIENNIIVGSYGSGIHITYADKTMLNERLGLITGNVFFNNEAGRNVWCYATQRELTPLPDGATELQNNLYEDPFLDSNYMPQNQDCSGKGYALP